MTRESPVATSNSGNNNPSSKQIIYMQREKYNGISLLTKGDVQGYREKQNMDKFDEDGA